ncbi:MAG TPA: RnfH family protein [Arenimonas sp.]|tara:strand:- start:2282 stop:2566 length:285 start_codon:yes stop_codon:yes gene_type:complete
MTGAPLQVEVVCARPGRAWRLPLQLPAGATVADALAAADLPAKVPGLVVDEDCLAIFGRAVTPGEALRDGDRVEVLRPLLIDPMQARRRRAREA